MNSEYNKHKLVEIIKEIENLQKTKEQNCNCDNFKEVKLRHYNQRDHYVYQCNQCGEQKNTPLKKNDALKMLNGNSPKLFDFNIAEVFRKRKEQASENVKTLMKEQNKIERILQPQR